MDGRDVPAELLNRLQRDWLNLKELSAQPKEKGLWIYVKEWKRMDPTRAAVTAGYWFPTQYAGQGYFGTHHVGRQEGKWVVEKVTNEARS